MDNVFSDESVAADYDASLAHMFDPAMIDPPVDFLAELAGAGGRALEFAVGTGRIALPLSERGVEVHGIELSAPMVEHMNAKPGADRVDVTIGDMATTRVESEFQLVYLVFNTITNLLTQDEQVECFRNAAAHLALGGHFVIEVGIPNLQRLQPGERFMPFDVTPAHLGFDEYDVVEQRSISHHYWVNGDRVTTLNSHHRYAWPAEYDLMARIAGLAPAGRWADWHRAPFTAESTSHVSAWRKDA